MANHLINRTLTPSVTRVVGNVAGINFGISNHPEYGARPYAQVSVAVNNPDGTRAYYKTFMNRKVDIEAAHKLQVGAFVGMTGEFGINKVQFGEDDEEDVAIKDINVVNNADIQCIDYKTSRIKF